MRWYAALLLQAQQDEEAARKVADKYEEKMARSRQIAERREALTSQLQRVRLSIAEQERLLKVRMHFISSAVSRCIINLMFRSMCVLTAPGCVTRRVC